MRVQTSKNRLAILCLFSLLGGAAASAAWGQGLVVRPPKRSMPRMCSPAKGGSKLPDFAGPRRSRPAVEMSAVADAKTTPFMARTIRQAYEAVAKDEHHHLLHTTGWTRELWIQSLGLPAVLPPPEEVRQVETKIGASRAEQARDQLLKKH